MKTIKLILSISLIALLTSSNAQIVIQGDIISDPLQFNTSAKPYLSERSIHSDSIAKAYGAADCLYFDGTYYVVNSWADYFLWFSQKYQHEFGTDAFNYAFHYKAGNDIQMALVIDNNQFFHEKFRNLLAIDFSNAGSKVADAFDRFESRPQAGALSAHAKALNRKRKRDKHSQ